MEVINIFSRFITAVKSQLNVKQILQNYETLHNLRKYKFTEILVENALSMLQQIVDKFYKNHSPGQSGTWVENQLKLYLWTVICYMELYRKSLQSMKEDDWKFFAQIFYLKQFNLFEYQARTLLDQSVKTAKWKDNEDILLYNLIINDKKAKWNQIAKLLYMNSGKQYLRTSKQCRERWLNHLDPSKSKSQWDLREYLILFEQVQEKGKKWAVIVKMLDDRRSEHSIKNKYNSIMKKKAKMNPQLTQNQAIDELIVNINRIMETCHVDSNDQYLFGCSAKTLNSQNKYRGYKAGRNERSGEEGQKQQSKNRIQNFRKKIEKFSCDQAKQTTIKSSSSKKQQKKSCFSKEKHYTMSMTPLQKRQNEKVHHVEQPQEDEIFYEQSFQVNDLLRPHEQNMMFSDDLKDLIKQHELDV